MLSQLRNSVFTKILWGLMGFYLLNISVDSADPFPEHIPEDLTFNDQESIIELVVEQILGYENAFEEYDDKDSEDHNKKSNVKIDLIAQFPSDSNIKRVFLEVSKHRFPDDNTNMTSGYHQLDTPPPKI